MLDCRRVFGLVTRFIGHYNIQLVITLNYSVIADPHTLQQSVTRRFLVAASNMGYSCTSWLKSFLNRCFLTTELFLLQLSPLLTFNTDPKENTIFKSTSNVACVSVVAGTCLQSRCPETALLYLLISRLVHSNGSIRYSI
jgi:hypothetical protein